MAAAVQVRAEADSFVGDFAKRAQAEDLKAARVGQQSARPTDEAVQPAHAPNGLVAGPQIEVIGVAQNDLRAEAFEYVLRNGFDRAGRAYRHKDRRLDGAMRQKHPAPPPAGCGCCQYVEVEAHQTILPGGQASLCTRTTAPGFAF